MGSDVGEQKVKSNLGVRSLDTHPHRPLETSQARARRSLVASAAARNGIATMVDALRISKPPRAPQNPRRYALIPLAEGRHELEARIRALEDVVATRDEEAQKLKRQLGRSLVRRRYLERERESISAKLTAATAGVKECYSGLVSARADLATLVDDIRAPMNVLKEIDNARAESPLEDIASALDIAQAKLALPQTEPVIDALPIASIALGKVRPMRTGSTAGSDDDAKSCASYASSTAFGDDREAQVETLVELVGVLDAKLSTGHPGTEILTRAKMTLVREKGDLLEITAERDRLRDALSSVTKGGELGTMQAEKAETEAELRYAKLQMEGMRQRLRAVEKIAEKAVKTDEILSRNHALEADLIAAKKTVGRLVQERNSLRKTATVTNTPNSIASKAGRGNTEAMNRILDWRRRASSENHPTPPPQPLFDDVVDDVAADRPASSVKLGIPDRKDALPDRATTTLSRTAPPKRRKVSMPEEDSVNVNDSNSVSDSVDVGVNDSASAHSLPVQGFLQRHDSFLSAGGISASNDEITITNNRNIFNTRRDHFDGLRGLLNGE